MRAEQSSTFHNNPSTYGAKFAIDNDVDTLSATRGTGGPEWIKLTLDGGYCVHRVMVYFYADYDTEHYYHATTYTCDKDGCTCDGDYCRWLSPEITGAEGGSSSCKYGDSLMFKLKEREPIGINEIAVYASKRKKNLFIKLCQFYRVIKNEL